MNTYKRNKRNYSKYLIFVFQNKFKILLHVLKAVLFIKFLKVLKPIVPYQNFIL